MDLNTPIEELAGIGPKLAQKLNKLAIKTVADLLFYFPRRWDDFSQCTPINQLGVGDYTIQGVILRIQNLKKWGKRFITKALVADSTGSLEVVWFNQPYLIDLLKVGDEVVLSGRVSNQAGRLIFQNPQFEKIRSGSLLEDQPLKTPQDLIHVGRIIPVYSETEGLTSKWLRAKIKSLLPLAQKIEDFLPPQIKKSYQLMDLGEAISQIHFPQNQEKLQKAKERLSFDEVFLLQLNYLKQRLDWQRSGSVAIPFKEETIKKFVNQLPFKLTNDQKKAAWEILKDLQKPYPALRLLDGDVGSGKTVVACLAVLNVVKQGYQAVLMCPTEILAKQHYERIKKLLSPFGVKIALLVGSLSPSQKRHLHQAIRGGQVDLVVGTHALIAEKVEFAQLALAIIDEQHRFGVKQRAQIKLKNKASFSPHLLSMTATPIPRTLALALYGDLDLSIIKEMPPGRREVITKIVRPESRAATYKFISREIKAGRQCFVVCPLISESDKLGVKAVTQEAERLQKEVFPHFRLGVIHGKMKAEEKDKIMTAFAQGELDLLVSTSVIEVGIDVPQATVMLIEGAERFGLAQLYQLRGRVGRSHHQAYCFLFMEKFSRKAFSRLRALVEAKNGFELAEKDLEIRGPGEIYGTRQHGLPDLKMASLSDLTLIKKARQAALDLLEEDPSLQNYPALRQEMIRFISSRHLE